MSDNGASFSPAGSTWTRPGSNNISPAAPTRKASGFANTIPAPYSRDALDKDLIEGFRQRQKMMRVRQVERIALAKGLGGLAVTSLKEGVYHPRKALPPLKPEEKRMFERMDFKDWRLALQVANKEEREEKETGRPPSPDAVLLSLEKDSDAKEEMRGDAEGDAEMTCAAVFSPSLDSSTSSEEVRESCPGAVKTFLKHLRSTNRATISLRDGRAEIEDNINMVEEALSNQCSPLSFATLLDAVSRSLEAMERGYLNEDLTVPDCQEDTKYNVGEKTEKGVPAQVDEQTSSAMSAARASSATSSPTSVTAPQVKTVVLHGATEVEAYTRKFLLPKAYKAIAIAHSAEWMLQYTMAFMRATEAMNQDEAEDRLVLLGRCVRLLGDTENFSSVLLSLEAKCEEYAGFLALKETAETHLGSLLDEVENPLDAILKLPFPTRRGRLLLIERGMQKKLQRALLFLNEIDYSWTPTAHFHWAWKVQFLSSTFQRIHGPIARKYMRCSMGFVDDALYDQVADTRITGRFMGASPIQPKVARARQVEYEKVTEGLTLQQIGMSVKGIASLVVGEQVCMGARYIVRQSTQEFDNLWGFHMDDVSNAPTEENLQKKVAQLAAKAKRQLVGRPGRDRGQPSPTFLTQNE